MKLISKYQGGTTRDGILDNTRVNYSYSSRFRPLLVKRKSDLERWEEYRMLHDKNELIGPVLNVPEDLRKYYRRRAETLLWMDQRARNFESFGNLLNLTMPSTYAGQIIGRKLTGPEALAVDLVTAPILGGIKTVGKKGVQAATKLATKGVEAFRRRFVYPREGLPQWFYTRKPLIAGGYNSVNPVGKVPEIPEGYTFIKEAELSGRNGKRKVHLIKDNLTGKTKILEDITFKSDLDWSKNWFEAAGRKYKDGSLTEYNDRDIKILESHIPEYIEIEKKAKADGTWLKMPDGSIWEGDPRSWVLYKSEAVQKQNPEVFATGIHKEIDPKYSEQLWGLPFINQSKLALARARTYVDKDSKVFPMFTKKLDARHSYTFDAEGSYWQAIKDKNGGYKTTDDIVDQNSKKKLVKINNVIDIGDHKVPTNSKYYYEGIGNNELIALNDIIILPNVFRKSLIGNNGDFKHPTNMFRGLIPLSISGLGYSMFNE